MTSFPLTPFETYFLEDDRPGHPCWQFVRMRWRGRFERPALAAAWAEATSRQPMLGATVYPGALGSWRWNLRRPVSPPLHWQARRPGQDWPDWAPINLATGPAGHLYALEDDEHTDLVLCFHHAVCDGLSVLDVAEDTIVLYGRARGLAVEARPPAARDALRRRGRIGATWWERCWLPVVHAAGMLAEAGLLRRRVAPLLPAGPVPPDAALPPGWPAVVTRVWSEADTGAIRKAAQRLGVSLPVLALRDLQAAVGTWRQAQGVSRPEDWIRTGMVIGLRRKTRGSWPVTNCFGIAIIDRSDRSLANRPRLLRRAREDLDLIDRWQLGYGFWTLLRLRQWWPGGIRAYARRPVVRMSLVLSYLGKTFMRSALPYAGRHPTVPGAVLEFFDGYAPTRPGTAACLDVAVSLGRFSAFLNYDPRALSRAQAESLLEAFAAQLGQSMAEPAPP